MNTSRNFEEMDRAFADATWLGEGYLRVTISPEGQRVLTAIDPRKVYIDPSRSEVNAAIEQEITNWQR